MAATEPSLARKPAWVSAEFGQIYEANSQCVYYLALRFLGDPALAQDATHDVFLKAFRKMDQFRGDSEVRTWLYRITINHCKNVKGSWHTRNMLTTADEMVWERSPSSSMSPSRVLENKELGQRIQVALDSLSEEYRLLLLLVADEKLSYEQAGELTEQTADAVRGKLHRARKAFALAFTKLA